MCGTQITRSPIPLHKGIKRERQRKLPYLPSPSHNPCCRRPVSTQSSNLPPVSGPSASHCPSLCGTLPVWIVQSTQMRCIHCKYIGHCSAMTWRFDVGFLWTSGGRVRASCSICWTGQSPVTDFCFGNHNIWYFMSVRNELWC